MAQDHARHITTGILGTPQRTIDVPLCLGLGGTPCAVRALGIK